MASADDTVGITSRWLVVLCLSASAGLNTPTYWILKNLSDAISDLRGEIDTKTADRFYRRDHDTYQQSHDEITQQRFSNVFFRFERNEAKIEQCLADIEKLKEKR